jgi:hypothetical protein
VIRNEINAYHFVIKWEKSPQRSRSSSRPYDTMARKLPPPEREEFFVERRIEKREEPSL